MADRTRSMLAATGRVLGWSAVVSGVTDTRTGRLLIINSLVDATGTGLFMAGSTLFFVRNLGLAAPQIGLGLALAGVLGLVAALPVGALVARVGPKRVLIGLHLWRAVGFALLTVVHDLAGFLIVLSVIGIPDRCSPATSQTYLFGFADAAERVTVAAGIRSMDNLGFALGAMLAFIPLLIETRDAYNSIVLADAVSFMAAAVLVSRMPSLDPRVLKRGGMTAGHRESAFCYLRNARFSAMIVANGLLSCHTPLLSVGVPLWLIFHTTAPPGLMSVLLAISAGIAVIAQAAVSRRVRSRASGGRAMAASGLVLAACCAVFATAADRPTVLASALVVLAVVILTSGELLQAAGSWAVSFSYAETGDAALYIAAFNLGNSARHVLGPLLVATCINLGVPGLAILASLFILAGIVCRIVA